MNIVAGEYLDILAISCDSFRPETNNEIGRRDRRHSGNRESELYDNKHVESLERVRAWCRDYRVAFKINTVVNSLNVDEDMNQQIQRLNPVRWKVISTTCCHSFRNFNVVCVCRYFSVS